MVSGNVISNLRRSCLSGCHRSCRVVVGLSGVGCCRVLSGAARCCQTAAAACPSRLSLHIANFSRFAMNALAAFGEWGCEDRLSGPAFAETTALVGWFRERDAHLAAGLQMSCGAAAGGIHAVAEIPRGAIVASIPLSLLITQATAHAEAELRDVRGGTNLMALFLLRHNRSGTAFHAYVAQLPRQLDQTHRWSDEELTMLEASDLVAHSRSRRRAVERHHEALPSSVRPSSPEALGWGLGQVRSYLLWLVLTVVTLTVVILTTDPWSGVGAEPHGRRRLRSRGCPRPAARHVQPCPEAQRAACCGGGEPVRAVDLPPYYLTALHLTT